MATNLNEMTSPTNPVTPRRVIENIGDDWTLEYYEVNGVKHGPHKSVMRFPRSIKVTEENYVNGELHGKSITYNQNTGRITSAQSYDDGNVIEELYFYDDEHYQQIIRRVFHTYNDTTKTITTTRYRCDGTLEAIFDKLEERHGFGEKTVSIIIFDKDGRRAEDVINRR